MSARMLNQRDAVYMHQGLPKSHYFSRQTRDMFLKAFETHLSCEESAELLRKRLSRRPKFSAHDAFTSMDVNKLGYVTKEDFRSLLAEN